MSDRAKADGGGFPWWEDRSLPQKIFLGIGLIALFGWVVMLLWNWLIPEIFGLKPLSYWQAWGVLVLCAILFKGFGSGHSAGRSDRKRRRHLRRYIQGDQTAGGQAPAGSPDAGTA